MEQLNLMRRQKEIWRGSKKEMEGKKEGESQRRGGRDEGKGTCLFEVAATRD